MKKGRVYHATRKIDKDYIKYLDGRMSVGTTWDGVENFSNMG